MTGAEIKADNKAYARERLISAQDDALSACGQLTDYWHDAAWEAYFACSNAIVAIDAGEPDND